MPLSIVGARTIVCSGYAQMAAALMMRAGAKKVTFINAVYASIDDILADRVSAGHTVAVVVSSPYI